MGPNIEFLTNFRGELIRRRFTSVDTENLLRGRIHRPDKIFEASSISTSRKSTYGFSIELMCELLTATPVVTEWNLSMSALNPSTERRLCLGVDENERVFGECRHPNPLGVWGRLTVNFVADTVQKYTVFAAFLHEEVSDDIRCGRLHQWCSEVLNCPPHLLGDLSKRTRSMVNRTEEFAVLLRTREIRSF